MNDPVEELVLAGKRNRLCWMKIECEKFPAGILNSWLDFPHMGDMENVEELLAMPSAVR